MDFELRQAKIKWEKEQKEKKDKARARLERERKAKEEAVKRQEAIEAAQRVRRLEESAAALAVRTSLKSLTWAHLTLEHELRARTCSFQEFDTWS